MTLSVTVWNEYVTQRENEAAREVYPEGIHTTIAGFLEEEDYDVRCSLYEDPEHGLTEEVLADTDVLMWWSHVKNEEIDDEIVDRVVDRVYDGMGLIVLHSGRRSKVFPRLMGTSCDLRGYRDADETERVWVVNPSHPIVEGLEEEFIEIPESQVVSEPWEIPEPEATVSWLEGGEVFRSGCCFQRGDGKIFFFGPGHETHPVYHMPEVQTVLTNAVEWARPVDGPNGPQTEPSESLPPREPLE
jgi:trehalose utilization protein